MGSWKLKKITPLPTPYFQLLTSHYFMVTLKRHSNFVLLLLAVFYITTACNKVQNCSPQNNRCRANLVTLDDFGNEQALTVDSLSLFIIEPQWKSINENTPKVSSLNFPVSHSANHITLALKTRAQWDTLHVYYNTQKQFNNVECGLSFTYHIEKVEHTQYNINQIRISSPNIDENKDTNLHFIFSRR